MRYAILVMMLAVLPLTVGAQEPDEQTQDYEDQDRRYYERYLEQQEQEADQQAEQTIAALKAEITGARDEAVRELERLQGLESEVLCKQAAQLAKLKR